MKIRNNTQLIFDFVIGSIFTLTIMTIIMFIIPDGLTTKFLILGTKLVSLVIIALIIMFLTSWLYNKNFKFKKKIDLPKITDFIFLILPMSPIIDYILINNEYLDLIGLIYLVGTTLSFTLIFSFIIPIFFSYFASFKIFMFAGLGLSFIVLSTTFLPGLLDG